MRFNCLIAGVLGTALAVPLVADEPAGKFQVHDFSLWILEGTTKMANARNVYLSPLPATVNNNRGAQAAAGGTAAGAATLNVQAGGALIINGATVSAAPPSTVKQRVAPLGVITFLGEPARNLDVDLRIRGGSFLGHWPPAESLPNRLRWSGGPQVDLIAQPEDPSQLMLVDDAHWFHQAREGQGLFVRRGARAERFLAYDAELELGAPIKLAGGPDKYTVTNTSGKTLHDVLISCNTPQGRRIAWLDVLPKPEPKAVLAPAKAAPPASTAKAPQDLFDDQKSPPPAKPAEPAKPDKPAATPAVGEAKEPATGGFLSKVAADALLKAAASRKDAKAAAPEPALPGVEVTLSAPLAADSAEWAAQSTGSLTTRLVRAGLVEDEAKLMAEHCAPLLFQGQALAVACRLGSDVLDDKMPLSIFPEPSKIVRVPLVVIRNADPRLVEEVDRLIMDLANSQFKVREVSAERLLELGPLAFPALNKALNHTDLEVVIRAERILLSQNQTAVGRQGATGVTGDLTQGDVKTPAKTSPRAGLPAAPAAAK
ncbi:MAG TPA: hypothetical protein VHV08_03060 [Pirellulales bacterium]|nr:hypothetical protein [Pirellulales bacterium]